MKKDRYCYPAIFNYEDEDGITVTFPDLPDCVTEGDDETDALKSAKECLGIVLSGMEEDGEEIPAPASLQDIKTGKKEKAVLVEVNMSEIRNACQKQNLCH